MSEKKKLNEILIERYKLTKNDFWQAKDAWVVRSSALRGIARLENITTHIDLIDVKVIGDKPFAYCMATAIKNDGIAKFNYDATGCAWIGNLFSKISQAYPVEMAEKRAVDRAIINARELDGLYSDSEADDFKRAPAVKIDAVEPAKGE